MPPESGGICGRLTQDLPLGNPQGGYGARLRGLGNKFDDCVSLFLLKKGSEFRVSNLGGGVSG